MNVGFLGGWCWEEGLFMWWLSSVFKEFGGVEVEEELEVEWLNAPHLLQVHEMLLLTNPVYICVNDPIQLT